MLQVVLQLVRYFRGRTQPEPAYAGAASATAAVALVTLSATDTAAALAPDPAFCEDQGNVANDDIGVDTSNPEDVQS